jgi:hypothetical protein
MIKLEELYFTYQTGVTGMRGFLLRSGANATKYGNTPEILYVSGWELESPRATYTD